MTDDDLHRAFAEARDTAASAEPLDAERVWRAARGELSPAETAEVLDRVAADPTAALAWRLARELPAGSPERLPAANGVRWFRALAIVAAAAAALLLVGRWVEGPPPTAEAPVYRGDEARLSLPPVRARRGEGATIRWEARPGARYTVVVLDEALREVRTFPGVPGAELALPADLLDALPDGRGAVQLVVTTPDGVERSAPASITVTP